jgi:hypothetical protein
MLPLTSKELIRFIPSYYDLNDQTAPTYLIGAPTIAGRASFRRSLTSEGLRYPDDKEMVEALKIGIEEVVEEAQQPELLKIIAKYQAATKPSTKLQNDMFEIEKTIGASSPTYANLSAERGYYLSMAPLLATRQFLKGIENSQVEYNAKSGMVNIETLDNIPEVHIIEIGWKVISLMSISAEQRKN